MNNEMDNEMNDEMSSKINDEAITLAAAVATASDVTVRFKNLASGLYMDEFGGQGKGAKVIQFGPTTGNNQKWTLRYSESDDTFVIRTVFSPTCFLSVENKSSTNLAKIIMWADETPTKWKIQYDEEYSAHRIVSEYGGYVKGIAAKDGSADPGTEMVIFDKSVANTNDRWIIEII